MAAAVESNASMNGGSRPMTPGPQRDNGAPLPPVPAGDGPRDELDPSYRDRMQSVLSSDVSTATVFGCDDVNRFLRLA
jgi:hypothetical protein